jgi:hypothetical protein
MHEIRIKFYSLKLFKITNGYLYINREWRWWVIIMIQTRQKFQSLVTIIAQSLCQIPMGYP